MIDFDFISPTKIFFGGNKEQQIGQICTDYGYKKVFIVIGQGSVVRNGLLDKIVSSLNEQKIGHYLFQGVRANPTIDLCRDAIKEAKRYQPDLILAVGGGSVVDSAKNIAAGYYYDGDSFDFHNQLATPKKVLPIGVILTIAAAGSEMSGSSVISCDETNQKRSFVNDLLRPVFVIENPKLTYGLSKEQIGYGIVDMFMHTLERYLNPSSEIEPADGFAEVVLKSIVKAAYVTMKNPTDYDARAILMLMSSLSHNNLTHIGKTGSLYIHQLEHAISGLYPQVAHAAGLAILFPAWAKYYLNYNIDKFDRLGKAVFDLQNKNKNENAKQAVLAIEKLFSDLGMPRTFKDLNIDDPDIDTLVDLITENGTKVINCVGKATDKEVAKEILLSCV